MKEVKRIDAQKAMHEARSTEQANEIAETLGKLVLRFDVKSGPTGSLFGSVTTTDIADEIWRIRKIRVDRRKIGVDNIKRIGRYTVPIDLFEGISAEVKLMVVPEGGELPPEEELAAMEAAEAAEAAAAAAAAAPADGRRRERVGARRRRSRARRGLRGRGRGERRRRDRRCRRDRGHGRGDEPTRAEAEPQRPTRRARGRPRRLAHSGSGGSPGEPPEPATLHRACGAFAELPARSGKRAVDNPAPVGEKPSGAGDRIGNTCSLPPASGLNLAGFPSFLPCPFGTG